MKYVVLLGDGMADDPQEERGGKSPIEIADTPSLDLIASRGKMGLARTVPADMEPGSDVANMAILGYDPKKYYSGRASIEAAALGIELGPDEVAIRTNLVTLAGEGAETTMDDYSGSHPEDHEQAAIVDMLNSELGDDNTRFVPGVSFRNICVMKGLEGTPDLMPPHDHAGALISSIAPSGPGSERIAAIQERARELLADHPVNRARLEKGEPPINGVWLWGLGRPPSMPSFRERHGRTGAVVTGVDLVRGLANVLGLRIMDVPGATGYIDTDFEGKAEAVIKALSDVDFVFLHVEAPDECGHEGDLDLKVKAIEDFDRRAVKNVLEGLTRFDEYRVLLMPDHETPVKERGHRGGPVPYAVADKSALESAGGESRPYSEREAAKQGGEPLAAFLLLESLLFS